MQEVARLEAQMEAADLKPKSKLSQRPKDTVMRDQTHSLSNIHSTRVKNVEPKQLLDAAQLLKLILQKERLTYDRMAPLLFGGEDFTAEQQISISDLKTIIENLGVISAKKGHLMARYLVEEKTNGEFVYNEQ